MEVKDEKEKIEFQTEFRRDSTTDNIGVVRKESRWCTIFNDTNPSLAEIERLYEERYRRVGRGICPSSFRRGLQVARGISDSNGKVYIVGGIAGCVYKMFAGVDYQKETEDFDIAVLNMRWGQLAKILLKNGISEWWSPEERKWKKISVNNPPPHYGLKVGTQKFAVITRDKEGAHFDILPLDSIEEKFLRQNSLVIENTLIW